MMGNVTRPLPHLRPDGFPRRRDILLLTPLELQIRECVLAVEQAGADPILTKASSLIQRARMLVADWLEADDRIRPVEESK